jgi:hypothetical protein
MFLFGTRWRGGNIPGLWNVLLFTHMWSVWEHVNCYDYNLHSTSHISATYFSPIDPQGDKLEASYLSRYSFCLLLKGVAPDNFVVSMHGILCCWHHVTTVPVFPVLLKVVILPLATYTESTDNR